MMEIEEGRELQRMRAHARTLRQEPDALMLARVRNGVRVRIQNTPLSTWDILAGWLRPAAISIAAMAGLCAIMLTLGWDLLSPEAVAQIAQRLLLEREVALELR